MTLRTPEAPLQGGGIRLEPIRRAHLPGFEALGEDPAVQRHTFVPVPFAPDHALTWVARYVQGWREGSRAGFAIVDAEDGSFLGMCALVRLDMDGREGEIGYAIAPGGRNRGVATAALNLVTRWALDELGLQRVELRIDEQNPGSIRVAERAGYVHEGTLRSVHFKDGRRVNLRIYSLLATDR